MNKDKREVVIRLSNEDEVELYERYIKEIIKDDGFSVMNHNKTVFIEHMKKELNLKK